MSAASESRALVLSRMEVLVTGGTGFLGRAVVKALLAAGGARVHALVRQRSRWMERDGVVQHPGDVVDAESVRDAMPGITHVVHLAGVVSRDPDDAPRMMRVHVEGTRHVLAAARAASVARVVVASSSGTTAVSRDPDFIADEDTPFATDLVAGWPYYLSKIYQERLARAAAEDGAPVVILSPSLLLGPGDTRGTSTEDILRFLRRQVPVVPPGGLNFVDVRDAADAFVAALTRGRPGDRFLLGGPNWTFAELFGRLERLTKVPGPRLRLPERWALRGASLLEQWARARGRTTAMDRVSVEMAHATWYLTSARAEEVLGFSARDPAETLLDTVRWLRAHVLGTDEALLTP